MNIRPTKIIAATILCATLGLGAVATAGADSTTTTQVTTTTSPAHAYRVALRAYLVQRELIARAYRVATAKARFSFEATVAANPGPSGLTARATARVTLDTALAAAAQTRATALITLGAPPTPPVTSVTTTTSPYSAYRAALKAYFAQRATIEQAYATATATARSTFEAAVAANPGPSGLAARATARVTLDTSLANAASARVTALTTLGAPPVPPVSTKGTGSAANAAYRAALRAYVAKVEVINKTFRAAVAAANVTLDAALRTNAGPSGVTARATARLAFANAVSVAASARLSAFTALGAPPAPPTTTTTTTTQATTTTN
jgi:trimeric autotransporter adhesin